MQRVECYPHPRRDEKLLTTVAVARRSNGALGGVESADAIVASG